MRHPKLPLVLWLDPSTRRWLNRMALVSNSTPTKLLEKLLDQAQLEAAYKRSKPD